MMKHFLLQEGLTLIRTFEAGARTTMMHYMQGSNPVVTLVQETAKEESVAYIRIMDDQGTLIAEGGELPRIPTSNKVKEVLDHESPVTSLSTEKSIFEVAGRFQPLIGAGKRMGMMSNPPAWCNNSWMNEGTETHQVIFLGLHTQEFDQARKEDIKHSLFMGFILFLLGSAGFYFLFLYQEMRVARTTLEDMKLYTRNVIESMPVGLITLDKKTHIVSCNAMAEKLTGKPFSECKGQKLNQAIPAIPVKVMHEEVAMEDVTMAGPVRISSSRLLGHNGANLGTVIVIRDMAEIRKMELQLELSRRLAALGKMAAGIAHEIRNPLGTLRGFAQFFGSQAKDDAAKEYSDLMISEVDRLNETVSALLQFSRPREPELQKVGIQDLLVKASKLLESDFAAHGLDFVLHCDDNVVLQADPDLLLQVLLNLIKNSIAATPEDGKISVTASQSNKTLYLQIEDSGKGMTPEEQERMFDPFYTTKKTGTGLGLALSHQIVEQHHGNIEVKSSPGHGTTITIVLPDA
ncbi:MAG: PAS domain-containing protein [Desulfobulbaceae bacterium]|nr:PAS domain-containing protein [Desulfobulbaceae bacterium]